MSHLKLISVGANFYLTVAGLGLLPYALLSSDFARFTSRSISYELAALVLLGVVALPLLSNARWGRPYVSFLVVLLMFVVVNITIIMAENRSPSSMLIFIGIAASFVIGALLSGVYDLPESLLKYWPIMTAILTLTILGWLFLTGGISYPQGILKPMLRGGVVSTELSNSAALALIALFYRRQRITGVGYIALFALVALQLWFFSVGTLLALMFIYTCIRIMQGKIYIRKILRMILWIGGYLGLIYVVIMALVRAGLIDISWMMGYFDTSVSGRNNIYGRLLEVALNNPWAGIGVGDFYMPPHHNILGLAAETGVVSVLLYSCFTISALMYSFFKIKKMYIKMGYDDPGVRILTVFFGVVLFLWMKGFVHDTWQDKITYFCLGFIVNYDFTSSLKAMDYSMRRQIVLT